jgi:hypothetical protein
MDAIEDSDNLWDMPGSWAEESSGVREIGERE